MRALPRMLALCIVVLIAGCLPAGAPAEESERNGAEEERTKMVMYDWLREGNRLTNMYSEVVDEFNERPDAGAIVTMQHIPGSPYYTKLNASLAANNGPDLFASHASGVLKMYADAERLLPLNEALEADPEWKSSFMPGAFDLLTFDGRIYAVPTSFSAVALFYNKEIFERYELTPPRTYEEMKRIVRTLVKHGVTPFAFGAKTPWTAAQFSELVANRIGGSEPFDAIMDGDGSWLHPSFIETGKVMQELKQMDAFPKEYLALDNDAVNEMFVRGEAAMLVTGSWAIGNMLSGESKVKDAVGVVNFPVFENGAGDPDTWLGQPSMNIAIHSEAKDPEEAIELLKRFTGERHQKRLAEEAGDIPVIRLDPDPERTPVPTKELRDAMSTMKTMFIFYDVGLGTVIGEEYNKTIQAILAGMDPEEAFRKLETFTRLQRDERNG